MAKIIERIRKAVPTGLARKLWVKSGGRCEYSGCNTPLWKDSLMQQGMNKAYISHIIAASPDGPRGHYELSGKLELDFSNLMLLCDECHNRIDEAQAEEHGVERLQKMKQDHEERIELLTGLTIEKKSHIVLYGARIGQHQSPLNYSEASSTIIPDRYPVTDRALELGLKNCEFEDKSSEYWEFQEGQLIESFERQIKSLLGNDQTQHFSLFALAPQPLLIKLGTLLPDLYNVDTYQRHREPQTWKWQNSPAIVEFNLVEPHNKSGIPVLVLSLSATITDDRIHKVLGNETSIWRIVIQNPDNDFLKSKQILSAFRNKMRNTFDVIKAHHGKATPLHVFPAMPVSAAVEMGRVWMPKADLALVIYDENHKKGGFVKAIEFN